MKWGKIFVGAAALMSSAEPALAEAGKAPILLDPSSPWTVDYADDFCRLGRVFGTGEQKMTLLIDRFSPGDSFRLTLIGNLTGAVRSGGQAKIAFGAAAPEQEVQFFSGTWTGKVPAWIFGGSIRIRPRTKAEQALVDKAIRQEGSADIDIAPITEADEDAVAEIQVGRPLRQRLVMRTGSMKAPFAAMRACTDELLTHWGIDVARYRQQSKPAKPIGSPGRWVLNEDYPVDMQNQGQAGLVQFRLTVGEDGSVAACHIQQSTNPQGFNDAVCQALTRRARFEPARDKDGKPLKSFYLNSVRFFGP